MTTSTYNKEEQDFLLQYEDMKEFCSEDEIINTLAESCLPSLPKGEYKKLVLKKLLKKDREAKSRLYQDVELFGSEVAFINSLPEEKQQKMMYLLLVWKKLHPHNESEWIKYSFKDILVPYFERGEIKKEDLSTLSPYGFKMRLVGSKMPLLCYSIPDI